MGRSLLKLYRTPHSRHWTSKVDEQPLLRQLTKEAGLGGKIYITDAEYDAVLAAAGNHGISIQTTWPEKEEGMMTKSKQLIQTLREFKDDSDDDDYNDEEPTPEEDDIFLSDSGPLGSRTSVSAGGKHIGEFKSTEEAEKAIVDWINKNKWYPGIWHQDDHGGIHPYSLESKNQKKIKI